MRAGWIGTINDFLSSDREAWIESLENHVQASLGETASQSNRAAWLNCHRVLKDQLGQFATRRPDVPDWGIAFEYELPRERGRRVDVAIIAGESVVLLEFKDFFDTLQAHVDQVAAYARDLSSYQAASHNRRVIPVLVKTLSDAEPIEFGQVWITGATGLCACIERTGVSYWVGCAKHESVFAEYAGAFAFLLRDWHARGDLAHAGELAEQGAFWLGEVLTGFLLEKARIGYVPGKGSKAAESSARALGDSGGVKMADALHAAGLQLRASRFRIAATIYFETARNIYEALYAQNPENVDIADGLGMALTNLGGLLSDAGQIAEAEPVSRRAVKTYEALYAQNPENVHIADGLGMALTNLGGLLRKAFQIREAQYAENPENVDMGRGGLGGALNNLRVLLRRQIAEEEPVLRRAAKIYEALYAQNSENVAVGHGLAGALSRLGVLLSDAGQVAEAEPVFRRAVQICEALYAQNPVNVAVGDGLGVALNNLGVLLRNALQIAEAEPVFRRAVQIREALYAQNPENVHTGGGLALALSNLGGLLRNAGQVAEAEPVLRRAVKTFEALYAQNPENFLTGSRLAVALRDLGGLLSDAGQIAEAEPVLRRLVQIREAL